MSHPFERRPSTPDEPGAVWITGVGTATPLGSTYAHFADHLLAGRSGIRRVAGCDVSEHPSQIAGQVPEVPCPPGDDPAAFARLHRLEQLMRWCCGKTPVGEACCGAWANTRSSMVEDSGKGEDRTQSVL